MCSPLTTSTTSTFARSGWRAKPFLSVAIVGIMAFLSACQMNAMDAIYNAGFQLNTATAADESQGDADHKYVDVKDPFAAKEEADKPSAIVIAGVTLTPVSNANLPRSVFESYWYAVDRQNKQLIPTVDPATIGGSYQWTAINRENPAYVAIGIPPGDYMLGAGLGFYTFGIRAITNMLSDGHFKDAGMSMTRGINPTWEPKDAKLSRLDTPYFVARAGDVIYLGDLHFVARPAGPGGGRYPKFSLSEVTQNLNGARTFVQEHYPDLAAKLSSRNIQWPDW